MKKTLVSMALSLTGMCLVAMAAQKAPTSTAGGQVDRGRYLVESVAMCGECHSPRDSDGQLDHSRWLQGAPVWFSPTVMQPDWAYAAPALAGLPSFTDADMAMVLEKGLQPNGRAIRPPMHVYHMNHEDAAAIVSYLKSLPPNKR
ncbi:MAG TPA: c-type cytochrome [Terriglobia bacterium]|jgi:mono/diheme cytochrome c family protein|nr:c-type cytochrome [Terriglobia bacterium]